MHMAERREAVMHEHRALCAALVRRDEAGASRAAVDHVRAALRARMQIEHASLIETTEKRPRKTRSVAET